MLVNNSSLNLFAQDVFLMLVIPLSGKKSVENLIHPIKFEIQYHPIIQLTEEAIPAPLRLCPSQNSGWQYLINE